MWVWCLTHSGSSCVSAGFSEWCNNMWPITSPPPRAASTLKVVETVGGYADRLRPRTTLRPRNHGHSGQDRKEAKKATGRRTAFGVQDEVGA